MLTALTAGAVELFSAVLKTFPVDEWSYGPDLNTATRLHEECLYYEWPWRG